MAIKQGENANASAFTPSFTAGEAISAGDAVALNLSDNKIYKASASAWAYRLNFIGFAIDSIASGDSGLVNIQPIVTEKTGLTSGSMYYLSDTQGAISTSAGTIARKIGRALSSGILYRPKNGTPVSGFIARSLALATAFAHCELSAYFTGGSPAKEVTLNGTTLYSSSSGDDISVSLTLAPDDTITCTGDDTGGSSPRLRILDR
jgi:hypothetical protein